MQPPLLPKIDVHWGLSRNQTCHLFDELCPSFACYQRLLSSKLFPVLCQRSCGTDETNKYFSINRQNELLLNDMTKQHLQKDLTISRENPISHLLSPIINSNWRCFCLTTARRLLISPSYCSLSLLISVSFSRSLFGFGWITKRCFNRSFLGLSAYLFE